jgi:hypothetical protein
MVAQPAPDAGLEKLAPRVAGLALVEVTEIKEVDRRPADGNLVVQVRLRIIRSTGMVRDEIGILKAYGGRGQDRLKPRMDGPVKLDTFEKGKQYWIAFSSIYDEAYWQGVINVWPGTTEHAGLFNNAVRKDSLEHRPEYHSKTKLTYSYLVAKDKKSWQVRMEKDGKLL